MQAHFVDVVNHAWEFANLIRDKFCHNDYSAAGVGSVEAAKLAGLVAVWSEIRVLSETKCNWCSGWGHSKHNCETGRAITRVARSNLTARSGVASARDDSVILNAQHRTNNDRLPRAPGAGGYGGTRKRNRKQYNKAQKGMDAFGRGV